MAPDADGGKPVLGRVPQLHCHEDAVPTFPVGTDRPTFSEAYTAVERLRWRKGWVTAGFEEQLLIPALTRHVKDVIEQRPSGPTSTQARWRPIDFTSP